MMLSLIAFFSVLQSVLLAFLLHSPSATAFGHPAYGHSHASVAGDAHEAFDHSKFLQEASEDDRLNVYQGLIDSFTGSLSFVFDQLGSTARAQAENSSHGLPPQVQHFDSEHQQTLSKRQLDGLVGSLTDSLSALSAQGSNPVGDLTRIIGSAGNILGTGTGGGPLDVWSRHPFVPPGPSDQRGPCPGLNAMANHGIINHNGVTNLFEATAGAMSTFGWTIDVALIAILPVLPTGDMVTLSWSIGGPSSNVQPALGGAVGLLGMPQGMSNGHNQCEFDASPTRNDVYLTGNGWTVDIRNFEQLLSLIDYTGSFARDNARDLSALRMHRSIATNPWMFYGPTTGFIFRTSGFILISECMRNYTSAGVGTLTADNLKSFFGFTDYPVPLTYREGWERIPENWYSLSTVGSINSLQFLQYLFEWAGRYPELAEFGGNLGEVNTFTGVKLDGLGDPTSIFANSTNLLCFLLQFVKIISPSMTNNIFATIFGTLTSSVSSLACPVIPDLTHGGVPIGDYMKKTYPGAARAGSGY